MDPCIPRISGCVVDSNRINGSCEGYRDVNLVVRLRLPGHAADGSSLRTHLCEIQINHPLMLEAKEAAHTHYEKVRKALPEACQNTKADPEKLEGFLLDRLCGSVLEAALEALDAKADGNFQYAFLLRQHLAAERKAERPVTFANLEEVPAGP